MAQFDSSAPGSHDIVNVSHHAQYQDPETEVGKWIQPSLISLLTPVSFHLRCVNMSSVRTTPLNIQIYQNSIKAQSYLM